MKAQAKRLDAESLGDACDSTWVFRGYQLDPGHFTTARVHFYRGELSRANTWRNRLDTTTNWAVVTVGAALTFIFGAPQNPHFVLLLVFLLVLTFLHIEARRYRYYALWTYRVHLMETDFFAAMLAPPFRPSADWADHLVKSLLQPAFPVTRWQAVGRRFRRNYIWLIMLLLVSWAAKLGIHPELASDWATLVDRAAVGSIPGAWVIVAVGAVFAALTALGVAAFLPDAWRESLKTPLRRLRVEVPGSAGPLPLELHPQEQLATIITTRGKLIASQVLKELGRGVTALQGTGMYTGETRDVLLCAMTEVQASHLRRIVYGADPDAFVVVSRAEDVRGGGFQPFEPPS
jgi:uncharacterized membrane protein